MSNEFDIDAPADMELLGGTVDDETEVTDPVADQPEDADKTDDVADEVTEPVEPAQEEVQEPVAKRDTVIPRARFDEVNAKLHAEREETDRLRAQLAAQSKPVEKQASAVDIDALEQRVFDAQMDGDKETAVALRAQINAELTARAEANVTERITRQMSEREARSAEAAENAQMGSVVSAAIQSYPFLDPESAEVNQQAIDEVVGWREVYKMQGYAASAALSLAVERVGPGYSTAQPVAVAQRVDTRKQLSLVNAAKAAAAQPPRVDAGVGNRAIPAGDSIIGSQDKWEKASESERLKYLA